MSCYYQVINNSNYQDYGGDVYLKNSSALETGITGPCTVGGDSTFAISCKYILDKDAAVRVKVGTESRVRIQLGASGVDLTI